MSELRERMQKTQLHHFEHTAQVSLKSDNYLFAYKSSPPTQPPILPLFLPRSTPIPSLFHPHSGPTPLIIYLIPLTFQNPSYLTTLPTSTKCHVNHPCNLKIRPTLNRFHFSPESMADASFAAANISDPVLHAWGREIVTDVLTATPWGDRWRFSFQIPEGKFHMPNVKQLKL